MKILGKIWDFITGIVPVDRWIRVVGNVLKWLSLAFILLFILAMIILMRSWGFTSGQRMIIACCIFGLMCLVLILGIILALQPGGLLYSPYEQSLRRGKRYGTEGKPIPKKKVKDLPDQVPPHELPPGQENQETKT